MRQTAEISPEKKETVEELTALLRDHEVIALAGFRGIPAPQFQQMRAQLRDLATLRVAKNTLVERAMEDATGDRPELADLEEHLHDQTVVIATDVDPFKLFRKLEATKSKAPAKGGETAEEDIVVQEGETPFQPGPIVGELQQAGIPAAIDGGKVVINEERVVVEQGQEIPRETAQALTRLDIHPVTVGLDFRAALEDATVFERDVLDVDMEAFERDFAAAAGGAFNLAVEIAWEDPTTLPTLLSKARSGALSAAQDAGYITAESAHSILSTSQGRALSLASRLDPDALGVKGRKLLGLPVDETPAEGGEEE